MPKNPNSITGAEAEKIDSGWDELAKMADDFEKIQIEMAPERAKEFSRMALDVEKSFDRRNQYLKDENEEMSEKEFEKWENAFSDEIRYADRELDKTDRTIESEAEAKHAMIYSMKEGDLSKTIEAQAGKFYRARMRRLQDAILESKDEKAKADLIRIHDFYPAVMEHLDFKYMTPAEVRDYGVERHEMQQVRAHNDVIRRLNELNELAKKYDVRPLTPRNFWTSDIRSKDAQTPAVSDMMWYDRNLVIEFYTTAFSSEIQSREMRNEQKERFGNYW